ncbi:uncharacterized protein N7496_011146 [Penicillium cataractarum]|uniref:Uncharacterized protein n=1 Tax=Penicillium cataractarum TaxID=2100454 RepID=A0A9W9UV73_9EURO|nr:uncharacterized protein N7496_011146 [Penicillium cataractarum]KAJ5358733.1 hypothetical protein N7496_011146 [Penicillium cataractarum]
MLFGRFEMAENPYNASDLNSVLHTLSSLTTPGITSRSASSSQTGTRDPRQVRRERVHTPRESTPSTPKSQSKTPAIDPSTITTWPAALRYVMRTVGQNEETQLRIRGLIRSQHNHERQWWKGREALLEKQQARGDKKKELDAVLRSIGAPIDSKTTTDENAERAELEEYDRKVYKASVQMAEALIAELRGMKIPFFGLQKSLIHDSDTPEKVSSDFNADGPGDAPLSKLTKSDHANLQRRMLGLLEDLCKE